MWDLSKKKYRCATLPSVMTPKLSSTQLRRSTWTSLYRDLPLLGKAPATALVRFSPKALRSLMWYLASEMSCVRSFGFESISPYWRICVQLLSLLIAGNEFDSFTSMRKSTQKFRELARQSWREHSPAVSLKALSLGDWIGCEARSAGVKTGDAAIGHLQATRWQK